MSKDKKSIDEIYGEIRNQFVACSVDNQRDFLYGNQSLEQTVKRYGDLIKQRKEKERKLNIEQKKMKHLSSHGGVVAYGVRDYEQDSLFK